MNTPWDTRLKRISKRLENKNPPFCDFIRWFTHESEVQLMDLPPSIFDHIIKDNKDLRQFVASVKNYDQTEGV